MAAITRRTLVTAGGLAAALGIGIAGAALADDGPWDSDDTNDAHTDDDGYGHDDGYDDGGYDDGAYGTASPVAGSGYEIPRTSAS